jgi:hypothetical protein
MSGRMHTIARFQALSTLLLAFATAGWGIAPANADFYANDAKSTDPNRAAIEALAKDLAPIAAAFGCEFAWGDMHDPTNATLEFVPAGDDVRKWTRLVTITTVGMPPQQAAQSALIKDLHNMMEGRIIQRGRLLDKALGSDGGGLPSSFMEYEIGQGADKEHNAVAVMKVRADLAGIVQIQARGKPLAREDADKMRNLAIPKQN